VIPRKVNKRKLGQITVKHLDPKSLSERVKKKGYKFEPGEEASIELNYTSNAYVYDSVPETDKEYKDRLKAIKIKQDKKNAALLKKKQDQLANLETKLAKLKASMKSTEEPETKEDLSTI